jgi:hypothetical protein
VRNLEYVPIFSVVMSQRFVDIKHRFGVTNCIFGIENIEEEILSLIVCKDVQNFVDPPHPPTFQIFHQQLRNISFHFTNLSVNTRQRTDIDNRTFLLLVFFSMIKLAFFLLLLEHH